MKGLVMVKEAEEFGGTETAGYSEENYYTATYDDKSKCSTIRVNIPAAIHEDIKTMVAKDKYPEYRTINDVVRDFCVHGMHMRKQQNLDDRNLFPNLNPLIFQDYLKHMKLREEISQASIEDLKDLIFSLARRGTTDNYQEDFGLLLERVVHLAEPWRTEALNIIHSVLKPEMALHLDKLVEEWDA